MLNNFLISFRVKNAYIVNELIYNISRIPLIGKLIPSEFYKYKIFKIISIIISIIYNIIKIFGYKLLYIYFFLILPFNTEANYLELMQIFIFLAILGSFINTEIFNPTKDKYYMLILMRMDAYSHTIGAFLYFVGGIFIGELVALLLLTSIPWYYAGLLVTLTVMFKFIAVNFYFYRMKKSGKVINENKPESWLLYCLLIILFLGLAYGLPYFDLIMPEYVFWIFASIIFILGIISIKKVITYPNYAKLYKKLLNKDNIFLDNFAIQRDAQISTNLKQISVDTSITSEKSGFQYFHDLFVKRHSKILLKSAKKTTTGIFIIGLILIVLLYIFPEFKSGANKIILNYLPFVLLLMYFINTGKAVTNAMFMNCDHSMLSYRFFRQPQTLLSLFRERLKTLIILNLIPALTLSLMISIILFVSGGASLITYAVIFFSILSMSIFFSVHNLVLYYLLQPYNIGMEMKSASFTIASLITYWVCYYISDIEVSSLTFGIIMIAFAIIYSLVSLILVYKLAPKTFRLR